MPAADDPEAPILPDWPILARLELADADATDRLAATISALLEPGDTVLLSGQLGAGKSHFSRALIRTWVGQADLAVPSPTFTLVQTYAHPTSEAELWHADLYRVGDPGELTELGLDEAMDRAISLIEWPDRMAPDWPARAALLHLEFDQATTDGRHLALHALSGSALGARLAEGICA